MNGNCDRCGKECQLRYVITGIYGICNDCYIKYKMFRNIEKFLSLFKKSLNSKET